MATAKTTTADTAAETEQDGRNRRRFDRRDTKIVARLDHPGGQLEGTVTNLSLEGCLFFPVIDLPVGSRVKLRLAGEKPVSATVKGVSERGVHCLLHAGGVTLGRLRSEERRVGKGCVSTGRSRW